MAKERRTREPVSAYQTESGSEALWAVFQKLPKAEREAFLRRLLEDEDLREDLSDSIVFLERKDEPSRPYEEFEEELRREGRL